MLGYCGHPEVRPLIGSCAQVMQIKVFKSCRIPKLSWRARLSSVAPAFVLRPGNLWARSSRLRSFPFRAAPQEGAVNEPQNGGGLRDAPGLSPQSTPDLLLAPEAERQLESELEAGLRQLESELLRVQLETSTHVDGAKEQLQETLRKSNLLEAIVGALRERLRREEERSTALEVAVAAGRVELAHSEAERQELRHRISSLRSEVEETQTKLAGALRRASELEARVVRLSQQNTALALRVGQLEEQMRDRVEAAGRAVDEARDSMRKLEIAADGEQMAVAKLQAQLADREAQLALLREGELELRGVLEQSKVAAAQLGEVLRVRDSELEQLGKQLEVAEREGSRRGEELDGVRYEISAVEAAHAEEVTQLRQQLMAANEAAGAAERAAEERQAAGQVELEQMRQQLQSAMIHAEQSSARRVAEVSALRTSLEQQLGAARQVALDARAQLAVVREQLDEVLSDEFLEKMEEDLRRYMGAGSETAVNRHRNARTDIISPGSAVTKQLQQPQHPHGDAKETANTDSESTAATLRALESREDVLRRQLESLSTELSQLQAGAVARLGPAMVTKAQELEATAAQCRKALRERQVAADEQGAVRLSQQLVVLSSEIAALYRLAMSVEARSRERAVRTEMQNREVELRGIMEQRVQQLERQKQLQQQQLQHQAASSSSSGLHSTSCPPASNSSSAQPTSPPVEQLRQAVQFRVQQLLRERQQQLMQQALAREEQLQAQLQTRLSEVQQSRQREVLAVQEAVEKQMRMLEASWRAQLETFVRSLQEAAVEKERLAMQASSTAGQVRQQLVELETLRRELSTAQAMVTALRRAVEGSQAAAATQSAAAAREVQVLAAQVQQLQSALSEREREYAAAAAAAVSPVVAPQPRSRTAPASTSSTIERPPTTTRAVPLTDLTDLTAHFPTSQPLRSPQQQQQSEHASPGKDSVSAAVSSTSSSSTAWVSKRASSPLYSKDVHRSAPAPAPESSSVTSRMTPPATAADGTPMTPIRPGWPAQFGGVMPFVAPPQQPLKPVDQMAAAGAVGAVENGSSGSEPMDASSSPDSTGAPHDTLTKSGPVSVGADVLMEMRLQCSATALGEEKGEDIAFQRPSSQVDIAVAASAGQLPSTVGSSSSDTSRSGSTSTSEGKAVLSVWSKLLIGSNRVGLALVEAAEAEVADVKVEVETQRHGGSSSGSATLSRSNKETAVNAESRPVPLATATETDSTSMRPATAAATPVLEATAEAGAAAAMVMSAEGIQGGLQDNLLAGATTATATTTAVATSAAADACTPSSSVLTRGDPWTTAKSAIVAPEEAPSPALYESWRLDGRVKAPLPLTPTSSPPLQPVPKTQPQQPQPQQEVNPHNINSSVRTGKGDAPSRSYQEAAGVTAAAPLPIPTATPAQQQQQQQQQFPTESAGGKLPGTSVTKPLWEQQRATQLPSPTKSPPPPPPGSSASSTARSQSPAAAAMAAAAKASKRATAANAANRASRDAPNNSKTGPSSAQVAAPPISEWGRPKSILAASSEDVVGRAAASPQDPIADGISETDNITASRPAVSGTGREGDNSSGRATSTFSSDAELGAEIAAIAQSLVQRTIGGIVGAAAGAVSSGSSVTTAVPPPPFGPPPPPTTMEPLSSSARIEPSPLLKSGSSSGWEVSPRRVRLVVAAQSMPQPGKATEDAFFLLTPSSGVVTSGGATDVWVCAAPGTEGPSALGVADGVGGWAEANVDPGQYSREIMDVAARVAAEGGQGVTDPRRLLAVAQASVRTIGSCTACVAVLSNGGDKGPRSTDSGQGPGGDQVLSIANLGDSGCRVVRRGSLLLATSAQEHQFNMPYQMAHPDNLPYTDTAEDAQMYQISLRPGDVVVLGTDGLFDNMWDEELVAMVAAAASNVPPGLAGPADAADAQTNAQQLATSLVSAAFRHAQDPAFRSPWAVEFANQPSAPWLTRLFPRGGRVDDITVVVAFVVEGSDAATPP